MFAKQVSSVGGACLFSSNSVAAGVLVSPGVYVSPVMSGGGCYGSYDECHQDLSLGSFLFHCLYLFESLMTFPGFPVGRLIFCRICLGFLIS